MKPKVYSSGTKLYETEATDAPDVSMGTPAPLPGAPAPAPSSAKVNVVDPDGNTFSLPENELPRALAEGYRVEKPDEKAVREYVDENKGISGDLKVGLKSLVSEGTFGILGAIDEHTGTDLERAKSEALKKAHTAANWIGGATGFAASMLYGGEIFNTASKAGKVAELGILGTRIGEKAAAEGITSALAHAAPHLATEAAEHAPGIVRKMIASGAGTAVEGAILSAPRALTEEALGDHDKAAETLLWGAGGGALLGLVGPLGGKIKEGFKSAYSGLAAVEKEGAALVKAEGKSAIGKMADDQAFRAIASNNASLKIVEKDARAIGGATGVGETLNKLGLVKNFREAPAEYAERLAAGKGEWGEKIGDLRKSLDVLHPEGMEIAPVFARIEKDVTGPLSQRIGMEPVEKKLGTWVESLRMKTEGGLSFERAHAARQDLDALIYEAKASASPAVEELKKVRRIFEGEFEKQGDAAAKAAGKDFLVPWKEAKLNYARLSAAEKGATDYAQREMTNRVLSPTDYGTGAAGAMLGGILTGNPLGALAGVGISAAHHVIRTEGNALAARALYAMDKGGLLGIEQALKGTAQKLDEIPNVLTRMGEGKMSAALETLPTHALTDLIASMNVDGGPHKGTAFARVSDQLTSLATDPARMAQKIAELTGPFAKDAPKTAQAYGLKLASTVTYLQQALPKKPEGQSPFGPKTDWRPSDAQLADFSRRVETALDPFVVLKRLEERQLGKPEVETLKVLYPKIYDEIRMRIMEHPRELPYSDRLQLGRLLDVPLDRSMAKLPMYQGTFAAQRAQQAGAQGSRPKSSGRSIQAKSLPQSTTEFQRIAAKG